MFEIETQKQIFLILTLAYNVPLVISILILSFGIRHTDAIRKRPPFAMVSIIIGNFLFTNGSIAACRLTLGYSTTLFPIYVIELMFDLGTGLYMLGYLMITLSLAVTQLAAIQKLGTIQTETDRFYSRLLLGLFNWIKRPSWEYFVFPRPPKKDSGSQEQSSIQISFAAGGSAALQRGDTAHKPKRIISGKVHYSVYLRYWTYILILSIATILLSIYLYDPKDRREAISLPSLALFFVLGTNYLITLPVVKILGGIRDSLGIRYETLANYIIASVVTTPFIVFYFGQFSSLDWFYDNFGCWFFNMILGFLFFWFHHGIWVSQGLHEIWATRANLEKSESIAKDMIETLQNAEKFKELKMQMIRDLCQENVYFIEELMAAHRECRKPLSYLGLAFDILPTEEQAAGMRGRLDSKKLGKMSFIRPKLSSGGDKAAPTDLAANTSGMHIISVADEAKLVRGIYKKFIALDSVYELNIPSNIREKVQETIYPIIGEEEGKVTSKPESLSLDTLGQVKDEVLRMIQSNNMPRYLKTRKI